MADQTQTNNNLVPDFYVDRVRVTVSTFGAALGFGISEPHLDAPEDSKITDVATIRMSLEHLKVMLIVLKKQLKEFEKANDFEVALPKEVIARLGLEEEKW